ncbi:MAG TPA: malto-oligosyltrehalose synthase, partial [Terriglobales bacterium]|nr:malto-oligosyltrehalose synthase [Terriglobales bacterium]
ESFSPLDQLLGQQFYRLSFWKVATEEINYRRFFNINELISLRTEDPRVFNATHAFLFHLMDEGKITGLRIDHIDGLYDPAGYLERVRARAGDAYVVVEKILQLNERLPEAWPVCGTTGYDFANQVNEIFCIQRHERKLSELYTRFTGFQTPYEDLVAEKKRLIIGKHMAGDVDRLANLLKRVSSRDRFGGDITLYGLKRALVEVLTFFPVYRSYVSTAVYREEDQARIGQAMAKAKEANPALLHELEFIEKFLLLEHGDYLPEEEKRQWINFIMRLQQLTGPLMAKGFEDTTLYIYNRLISLNEVGGDPGSFGCAPEAFHEFNGERARRWPQTMNATSTHDTKRGEDVRARINVLSEIPDEWEEQVLQWSRLNRRHKPRLKGREVPDRNDEYFLYQSLLGAWPFDEEEVPGFRERVKGYMIKAVREAKVHTEWLKPDLAYEEAFVSFLEKILEPSESNDFLHALIPFTRRVSHFGALNSLSQTLLKIASPGLPDFYQGTELWDLNFVDPDNRRPVDFGRRRHLLEEIRRQESNDRPQLIRHLLSEWQSGKAKLFVTHKALSFRRHQTELFRTGSYLPLRATGKKKDHLCAFGRRSGEDWALVLVPRYVTRLCAPGQIPAGESCWGETALVLPKEAPERWRQVFTGEALTAVSAGTRKLLALRQVFETFPVALLAPADGSA